MVDSPHVEPPEIHFAPYVQELQGFFGRHNVAFGSPQDINALTGRLAGSPAFSTELSTFLRTAILPSREASTRVQLFELLAVAIGGPKLDVTAPDLKNAVRQLFAFACGVLQSALKASSGRPVPPAVSTALASAATQPEAEAMPVVSRPLPDPVLPRAPQPTPAPARVPQTASYEPLSLAPQGIFPARTLFSGPQAPAAPAMVPDRRRPDPIVPATASVPAPNAVVRPASAAHLPLPVAAPAVVPAAAEPVPAMPARAALTPEHVSVAMPAPLPEPLPEVDASVAEPEDASQAPLSSRTIWAVGLCVLVAGFAAGTRRPVHHLAAPPPPPAAASAPVPRAAAAPAAATKSSPYGDELRATQAAVARGRTVPDSTAGVAGTDSGADDDDQDLDATETTPAAVPQAAAGRHSTAVLAASASPVPYSARGETTGADRTDAAPLRPYAGAPADPAHEVFVGSSGIMTANVLSAPAPAYPARATASSVQGQVTLEAVIGKDGSVTATQLLRGNQLLGDAARAAVLHWRYRPYTVDGRPTDVTTTITMNFRLHQ